VSKFSSNLATGFLIAVEKVKDGMDRGVDKVLDRYEEFSVWAEHQNRITATEKKLREANPYLYEYLPEVLGELADIPGLTYSELHSTLTEIKRLKSEDSAPPEMHL